MSAAGAMIPHPAKVDKGGEDAFFICDACGCLGVADGVGGWAEIGVDPGLYSRELMCNAQVAVGEVPAGPDRPQRALELAHGRTGARGSATACIICVHEGQLHASNLGDSGFMVVRDGELAFMSPQQQHEFNFPYQIGSADSMADMPSAAQRFSLEVAPGDIIVAATDGVFDNVYPDEAAALVSLYSAGVYEGRTIERGVKYVETYRPSGEVFRQESKYFYGHYYAAQAMWHAGGEHWNAWFPAIRDELQMRQMPDGCWPDSICSEYGTAMACIVLQMPNQYVPIFQR